MAAISVANLALGVAMSGMLMAVILTVINMAVLMCNVTAIKWSVRGLYWRKALDEKQAVSDKFEDIILAEYERK